MASPVNALAGGVLDVANLFMGLLAAHDARVKAAKEENAACNQASAAQSSDMQTIANGFNSGVVTSAAGVSAVMDVRKWYWAFMAPIMQQPGEGQSFCPPPSAGCSGSTSADPIACSGNCRITCCIGCNRFEYEWAGMTNAFNALANASAGTTKTVTFAAISASKYGYTGRSAFTIKLVKPKAVAEAEVTVNTKTGVLTVGAAPTSEDLVAATGAINPNAAPDSGGVDITEAQAASIDSTGLSSLFGGDTTLMYVILGFAGLVLLSLLFRGKPKQQEVVVVAPGGNQNAA